MLGKRAALCGISAWALSLGLNGAAAHAQASAPAQIDEVVVTATRRSESAHEVPAAITAIGGDAIVGAGVIDVEALHQVAPSLFITSSNQVGLGAQIRLRGVGTATGNPGLEGSVGVFLDGFYLERSNLAFNDLVDIERVEVLRGPQGTLFGRNTSAGVINIITRSPSFTLSGKATANLSNYDGRRFDALVTGPLVADRVAFSLAGQINKRDGYVEDINLHVDDNDRNRFLARGQLLWTPNDSFSLRLIADNSGRREASTAFIPISYSPTALGVLRALGGVLVTTPATDYKTAISNALDAQVDEAGYSATAEWKAGAVNARFLASYRKSRTSRANDADATSLDVLNQVQKIDDTAKSLEGHLYGTVGRLDWLAGAFWFENDTREFFQTLQGSQAGAYYSFLSGGRLPASLWPAGAGMLRQDGEIHDSSWSAFSHNTLHLTDTVAVTTGVRYTHEAKHGGSTFVFNQAPACTAPGVPSSLRGTCANPDYFGRLSDDRVTYNLSGQVDLSPQIMAYATYSTGFKSGGINLDPRAGGGLAPTFGPETVDNIEAGMKTQFLDRRLVFNATVFRERFHDYQLNTFTGTQFVVSNQGTVTSKGVEAELTWRPTPSLTVRASGLYNETRYGDDVPSAGLQGRINSNAPKLSGTLGVAYSRDLPGTDLVVTANADARAMSAVYTASNLDPRTRQTGYGVVNLRLGLRDDANGWSAALWAHNVGDVRFKTIAFSLSGSYYSYYGEPRVYGVELTKRF